MPVILTRRAVILLAIASAIVTANAYYIHPIIGHVAEEFGVSNAMVGAVPALNQIALALGILLLLPLGDRLSNRKLTTVFLAAQV
ncbi:MAG: MFS family permease, partial [Pseudohongiellaceae bacterium]